MFDINEKLHEVAHKLILSWIYGRRYRELNTQELWMILSKQATEKQLYNNNWRRLHNLPMMRRK